MQDDQKLFELVKSLSKAEKSYFRKFAVLNNKNADSSYVELFLILDKHDTYDRKKITDKLPDYILKNLASVKHYLYEVILKSLRNFHQHNKISIEVDNHILNIRILFEKGLYEQCFSLIARAKKLILKYEFYIDYYRLLEIERVIVGNLRNSFQGQEPLFDEEEKTLQYLRTSFDYRKLSGSTYYIIGEKFQFNKTNKKNVFGNKLLRDVSNAKTFFDKQNYYQSNYRLAMLYSPPKISKARANLIKCIELWEAYPHFIEENKSEYAVTLQALITILEEDPKLTISVPVYLEKLKEIRSNSLHLNSKLFQFIAISEQNFLLIMGKFEKSNGLIKRIEQGLEKFSELIIEEQKTALYFNCVYLNFGQGDYRSALSWMNKLLAVKSPKMTMIVEIARVINIFIHIELGNLKLVNYLLRSVDRSKTGLSSRSLNKIVRLIKMSLSSKYGFRIDEKLFRETISGLLKLANDKTENQILKAFDFISYLESKLSNRSFQRVVKEKLKKLLKA